MTRGATIASPDVCLRIYYGASAGMVGSKEIKELYSGCISESTIARIKKRTREKMAEKGKPTIWPDKVNVDVLFEVIGLDVNRLERNRLKLMKLGFAPGAGGEIHG